MLFVIALCPNPFRDHNLTITRKLDGMLRAEGFETSICPVFAEEDPSALPEDLVYRSLNQCAEACTLAVVIGGDVTILAVVRSLHGNSIPVLGINLGTKGFMTALEPENIELVPEAAKGHMKISRRMMLDVALRRNGQIIYTDHALNDVVLHGYGDCIQMTAWCDGAAITSFSGDGIILSTPTGSTGYSMSAGGPIVEPDASNIILSPICAHRMGSRSFVLDPGRTVVVRAEKLHGRRAYLSVDGASAADLENSDEIIVKKSRHDTLMADMGLKSFYEIAFEKLI